MSYAFNDVEINHSSVPTMLHKHAKAVWQKRLAKRCWILGGIIRIESVKVCPDKSLLNGIGGLGDAQERILISQFRVTAPKQFKISICQRTGQVIGMTRRHQNREPKNCLRVWRTTVELALYRREGSAVTRHMIHSTSMSVVKPESRIIFRLSRHISNAPFLLNVRAYLQRQVDEFLFLHVDRRLVGTVIPRI